MGYTTTITIPLAFDEAVPVVKQALQEQGFGTLTEIDVRATLHEKLGTEMEPYLIIGACNPRLAQRALDAERRIGALLPCNVVVRQVDGGTVVDALDPAIMASVTENPALQPVATEAAQLIGRALSALAAGQGATS
jgi:uncharacterized protein (DUF302 family)